MTMTRQHIFDKIGLFAMLALLALIIAIWCWMRGIMETLGFAVTLFFGIWMIVSILLALFFGQKMFPLTLPESDKESTEE